MEHSGAMVFASSDQHIDPVPLLEVRATKKMALENEERKEQKFDAVDIDVDYSIPTNKRTIDESLQSDQSGGQLVEVGATETRGAVVPMAPVPDPQLSANIRQQEAAERERQRHKQEAADQERPRQEEAEQVRVWQEAEPAEGQRIGGMEAAAEQQHHHQAQAQLSSNDAQTTAMIDGVMKDMEGEINVAQNMLALPASPNRASSPTCLSKPSGWSVIEYINAINSCQTDAERYEYVKKFESSERKWFLEGLADLEAYDKIDELFTKFGWCDNEQQFVSYLSGLSPQQRLGYFIAITAKEKLHQMCVVLQAAWTNPDRSEFNMLYNSLSQEAQAAVREQSILKEDVEDID